MSEQDRNFVERSGLSAAKIAQLLGKSRQAVSKGIGGPDDYFSSSDLVRVADRVGAAFPEAGDSVQKVVGDIFQDLANQIGKRVSIGAGIGAATAEAQRLWLILPDYLTSYTEQPDAYIGLFSAIDARRPAVAGERPLEVIIFCHRGRAAIEMQFDESWFDQRQLAIIQCEVIDNMLVPMLIADPHLDTGRACYALAANGFEAIAPALARSRVLDFAGHVTEKIRATAPVGRGRPLSMLTATPALLLEAGIEKL